ncbi:MAG: peptidase S24 [Bacteroidetes bacterium]|nr:MAG: peptidase S24 [Bacteroidota bacterium]
MNSIVTQRFIKCHNKLREDNRIKSSRQFALALDYLPQSLSEIMKGRRDVTIELLRKAIQKYKINPIYLFTGEGPLFMSEETHKDFRVLTIVTDSKEDEQIVHVPVPAQPGYANEPGNPAFTKDLPTFSLPDYKYKVGTHRSFDVAGDNMEPTLFEGDKVVCSFLDPTLWLSSLKINYVYVIITRAEVMIRRIKSVDKDENLVSLISDNTFYPEHKLKFGEIREIWYVRAKISPFLPSPNNIKSYLAEEMYNLKQTLASQSKLIVGMEEKLNQFLPPDKND